MNPFAKNIFQSTTGVDKDLGTYTTEIRQIGTLSLPTGKIVACDPLVFPDSEPFALTVRPGAYPVCLHIVHFGPDHLRTAYAILRFKNSFPVRWEMATIAGQDLAVLKEDEFFGYSVDAGTGCFMDVEAANLLAGMEDGDKFYDEVIEPVYDEWADIQLNGSGLNLILFHSGWGDGAYPSYWGYDGSGEVVCLVTDFGVLES